jgi:predicted TPR repeat methyltransferase
MRKLALSLLLLVVATQVFAHAGEVHKYMGTVASLNADGSFALKKTDGATIQVAVSNTTAFRHADGSTAKRDELAAGRRVVVTISKDGKTASEIKFAARKA